MKVFARHYSRVTNTAVTVCINASVILGCCYSFVWRRLHGSSWKVVKCPVLAYPNMYRGLLSPESYELRLCSENTSDFITNTPCLQLAVMWRPSASSFYSEKLKKAAEPHKTKASLIRSHSCQRSARHWLNHVLCASVSLPVFMEVLLSSCNVKRP